MAPKRCSSSVATANTSKRGEPKHHSAVGTGELAVTDIVPGARTVLLDGVAPGTAELLASWPEPAVAETTAGPLVEIPTTFDGEDLPGVAELWDVTVERKR